MPTRPAKLKKSASLAQRGKFYDDDDIRLKIEEQEAKVKSTYCCLPARYTSSDMILLLVSLLQKHTFWSTIFLAYSSLGVIYGDIGTSPLYVFSSIFVDFDPDTDDVLGALSLIFWSVTLSLSLSPTCSHPLYFSVPGRSRS
jgi:hypothetical protein